MLTISNKNKSKDDAPYAWKGMQRIPGWLRWIVHWRWWMMSLVAIVLIYIITYDFTHKQNELIHLIEAIIFIVLLFATGSLLVSLSLGVRNQTRIIKILDAKHRLSLDLSVFQDWDGLVDQIARFPGTLAKVSQTNLFVPDTMTGQLVLAAQFAGSSEGPSELVSLEPCRGCIQNGLVADLPFSQCNEFSSGGVIFSQLKSYCLQIKDGTNLLGILQFTLEQGMTLTDLQAAIFSNIGDEIMIALKNGQERRNFYEMLASETALAERRSVSQYLHDHLGQNLGFLHIKLDQLITQGQKLSLENVLHDLEMMRNAANDSYKIVHGILEKNRPETSLTLTNLLLEHSRKVSLRANIEVDFKTRGTPMPLLQDVQSTIFYAFEELLSNIEKHARADKISILADWSGDEFILTIHDNGIGFDPQSVNADTHFGLEIMNERMAKIKGRIHLTSEPGFGMTVEVLIPNLAANQASLAK